MTVSVNSNLYSSSGTSRGNQARDRAQDQVDPHPRTLISAGRKSGPGRREKRLVERRRGSRRITFVVRLRRENVRRGKRQRGVKHKTRAEGRMGTGPR